MKYVLWCFCSYVWNKGNGIEDDCSADDVWLEWEVQQLKVCRQTAGLVGSSVELTATFIIR